MHELAPPAEYLLTSQSEHDTAPGFGEYLPATQLKQTALFDELWKEPAEQSEQALALEFEYIPAAHVAHDNDPAAMNDPAVHATHEEVTAEEPAGHFVQNAAPATETKPTEHLVHFDPPRSEKNSPIEQLEQATAETEDDTFPETQNKQLADAGVYWYWPTAHALQSTAERSDEKRPASQSVQKDAPAFA